MTELFTLISGLFIGYISHVFMMKINFKQRTIDLKIKVYDSIITSWVMMRNQIFHGNDSNKWYELDKIYGQSQTYVGEALLVSHDQRLSEDINEFNERFYRQSWNVLEYEEINNKMEQFKQEAIKLIARMRNDIHESTRLSIADLRHMFMGSK